MTTQTRPVDTKPWQRCLAALLLAGAAVAPLVTQASMVRLETALGPVDIELYDTAAPATVGNFLGYVRSGAYGNSFIHRSVPGFIIQGGGYTWVQGSNPVKIPAGPPVVNEFSATRSNLRATVAMAKLGGNPNSATTEWFVNLANNAANLDSQNGGFTVFGRVTTPGMAVVDAIAALQIINFSGCVPNSGAFTDLPVLVAVTTCAAVSPQTVAMVKSIRELPAPARNADRIFNYLEGTYPQYTKPSGFVSTTDPALGYYYRYYPESNSYVGEKDGNLYYLVPAIDNNINLLGSVAEFLALAAAAGY